MSALDMCTLIWSVRMPRSARQWAHCSKKSATRASAGKVPMDKAASRLRANWALMAASTRRMIKGSLALTWSRVS